jgi:hypothetical protein
MVGYVANVLPLYIALHSRVRGAPYRTECPVFMREPRADDEWPFVRVRDQMPSPYPMIEAV